ncbi:hypothetical protein CC1G_13202 [Coprinopsis cinerea okayama7|uniref:Acyl-CoA thioesterase-like N-terminal HotDog domain-containing protein n=1 Tax=Coprinopsis cinerea (strain Okayama-7 / 130 / ATCC MYA-4618 / FGSC 9003) TaxID=240176 RepID=A8PG95_COPC7|nr:hypothetical protein CC1G_13202 [Coprinopsis cinerea okayama7\|eukprot:XP_001841172.1 hypothetical protein CC1G_13202 [Coprinopsis cinerea okayama7\
MAPFNQAVTVHRKGPQDAANFEGRTVDYEGIMDPTWNIGNVPCGGYSLALILEACIQHQEKTEHIDPLHISSHFLKPTTSALPFLVRVRTVKTGKTITNLLADLIQGDALRITAHAMFGLNGPLSEGDFVLQPPSPYARRLPLYSHPSQAKHTPMFGVWRTNQQVSWAHDTATLEKNQPGHPNRTNSETVGGGGTEWAAWFQFEQPTEKLSNVYIPLLVDMFMNTRSLLPLGEGGTEDAAHWAPTMTLAVDFKFPVRNLTPHHSSKTVGLYSSGRFVNHPQSRHDIYVEVWSAPSKIGEGAPEEGWRDKQICLAIATQMALTLPMAVNLKNAERNHQSLKAAKL